MGLMGSAIAAALVWQLRAAAKLHAELERETHLCTEQEQRLASQSHKGEIAGPSSRAEALSKLRSEVATLHQQVERAERLRAEEQKAPSEHFALGQAMLASEWSDAGMATPQAALESVLWAGAGGDVPRLASMLGFIPGSRTRQSAQGLLERLPEPMRAQYDSPEQLIAFLTIKDIPLGSAELRGNNALEGWSYPAAQLVMVLTAADGKSKDVSLPFMNAGAGWKLVVTDAVIAKYAATLQAAKDEAAGK